MADTNANINVNIDTSNALASIKLLQSQISAFHTQMSRSGAQAAAASAQIQQNLINSLNASGKFNASIQNIKTSAESFTTALEKNKLSMGEYFRYSIASTKSFGKMFKTEFDTINNVARERVKDLQTQYIKLGRDANGAMKAIAVRPLMLDMDNLGTKTQIAAQRQQILNQLLKQGSTNMLNFGKNTQWAGRQLMVGFSVPMSMAATAAAKAYMEIEKASVAIRRVYGDMNTSAKETDQMVSQIQRLALEYTKYGVAVADTMDMAAKAAAMGKTGADLLAQINQATKLSVLGGVDQQQALETTISLTNAFGIATQDLSKNVNYLNAVENQTVLSIEDMTVAVPKAAPVIKQLGGNVQDLAFFLTAMKEGGVNAAEGANALKSGLSSIINPTKKATDFLAGFGVNLTGIVEKDKGNVRQTVLDVAKALDTLDPLNRSRAIEMMFGKFQFARMSTLFKNITDGGSQAAKALELTKMTAEELQILSDREMKKVSDSPMYKFQKSIEDLKAKIAPIGEEFLKAVTPILGFVSKFLEGFNKMGDGTKQFIVLGSAIVGIVAPAFLMFSGLVLNGAANILKLFANVKAFFNRTGTASKVLGEETKYLTSEQIKAMAVAASLEQAHNNLKQAFTSERQAIELLIGTYQKATSAQAAFMGRFAAPATKTGGKKYAEGGVIVGPGTGTSDSITAQVSNGEAVIPAAAVKKNPRIISALVAGMKINLPGFAKSNVDLVETHLQEPSVLTAGGANYNPALVAQLFAARPGMENMGAGVQSKIIALGQFIAMLPRTLNENLKRPLGVSIQEFERDWNATEDKIKKTVLSGLRDMGHVVDPNDPQLKAEIAQMENKIKANVKRLAAGNNGRVTDPILAQAAAEARQSDPNSRVSQALTTRANTLREYRTTYTKDELVAAVRAGQLNLVRAGKTGGGKIVDPSTGIALGRLRTSGGLSGKEQMDKYSGMNAAQQAEYLGQMGLRSDSKFVRASKSLVQNILNSTKRAAGIKSPAKEFDEQVGKPIDQGIAQGIEKNAAVVEEATTKVVKKAAKKASTEAKNAQYRDPETGKFAKAPSEDAPINPKTGQPYTPAQQARMERREANAAKFGRVSNKLMGASMVVGMATMIPGQVGQAAQSVAGPLMGVATAFQMLPGPLAAIVSVAGITVMALMKVQAAFDDAQKSAIELKDKVGNSSEAIQNLATFSGNVTSTEFMNKYRENQSKVLSAAPGKTSFGETFLKSDQGAASLTAYKTQMSGNKGRTIETVKDMTNQLQSAVVSGALSMDQAKSIAANMAHALGDESIAMKVIANITEVLGPDGQDFIKNPMKVAAEVQVKNQSDIDKQLKGLDSQTGKMGLKGTEAGRNVMGGTEILAATGIGAMVGSVIPGIGTAVGAAVGAVAGATAGAFMAINQMAADAERAGKMSGAVVASMGQALTVQQQMSDSLDAYYIKKIAEAKAEGDITKEKKLQAEYDAKKDKLSKVGEKTRSQVAQGFQNASSASQEAMSKGVETAIKAKYKDNPDQLAYLDSAQYQLKNLNESGTLSKGKKFEVQMLMKSGELTPQQVASLFDESKGKSEIKRTMSIITKFGGATAAQMDQVTSLINTKTNEGKQLKTHIQLMVSKAKSASDAQKILDFAQETQRGGGVLNTDVFLGFYEDPKNKKAHAKFQKIIDAANSGKPLTTKMIYNIDSKLKGALNEQYFNKLNDKQKEVYTKQLAMIMDTDVNVVMKSKEFLKWQKETGKWGGAQYADLSLPAQVGKYADAMAQKITTETGSDSTGTTETKKDTGGGGGGPTASSLDSIVQKLKEVQKNQIKMTTGWDASLKAIRAFAAGAKKSLSFPFSGMQEDLLKLKGGGVSKSFIDLVLGMSPEEYEKNKKKLFKFDNKGNITGLKKDAKDVQTALAAISMGSYKSNAMQEIKDYNNKQTAVRKLVAAGLDVKTATEMASDAELAYAIATSKSAKDVANLVKIKKELLRISQAEAMGTLITNAKQQITDVQNQAIAYQKLIAAGLSSANAYAIVSNATDAATIAAEKDTAKIRELAAAYAQATQMAKDFAAVQAVNASNDAFNEKLKVTNYLFANLGKYTKEQISAILNDPNLAHLVLNPDLDPAALQQALDNAAAGVQLEISQLAITDPLAAIDKILSPINQGISNAMEQFAAMKQQIELSYEAMEKPIKDQIDKYQDQIDALNNKVSQWNYGLKQIERQEKVVNESYDERFKALDKLSKINDKMAKQQKSQLDIAEAITTGDIAAAAKAAQDMRAQNATDAIESQRAALEDAKQREIDNIRDSNGQSRKQLEQLIADTEFQILTIQQNQLKPLQDQLAELEKKKKIEEESLTVAGKTEAQWKQMQADMATLKTGTDEFAKSIQGALDKFAKLAGLIQKIKSGGTVTLQDIADALGVNLAPPPPAATTPPPAADASPRTMYTYDPTYGGMVPYNQAAVPTMQVWKDASGHYWDSETGGTDITGTNLPYYAMGGVVAASKFARGKFAKGTDTIPAMLTPGEFIVKKSAVDRIGSRALEAINNGRYKEDETSETNSMYNSYELNVHVKTDADADDIARTVITKIREFDSQRLRSSRY